MKKSQTFLEAPSGNFQILDLSHEQVKNNGSNPSSNPSELSDSLLLSLVLPTYNEASNIESIIQVLTELLDKAELPEYELIVVDDNSPDRTWEIAQALLGDYPHLRVMRRQAERGLSSAVIRGWQVAQGTVLGVIDADLQHPPEVLLALFAAIKQGADLATASRHIEGGGVSEWSLIRRFLSRGAQLLGLILLPKIVGRISDPMSGYFLVRRQAIAGPILNPMGYKILIEVLGRGNIKQITEVGYVFQERRSGESKVSWKQYIEYFLHLLSLRSRRPLGQDLRSSNFPMGRFLRFGLVGLSGVFVDMAVLYLLSDPTTLAWDLTLSKVMSAEVAVINNFLWNDAWTFADVSKCQTGGWQRLKRFFKFNTVCIIGVALNILILNLLVTVLGVNRYVANLTAISLVTAWNFWINLKLNWRVTETEPQ